MEKKEQDNPIVLFITVTLQVVLLYVMMALSLVGGTIWLYRAAFLYEPNASFIALSFFVLCVMWLDMIDSRARVKLSAIEYNKLVDESNALVASLQRRIALQEERLSKQTTNGE